LDKPIFFGGPRIEPWRPGDRLS